MRVPRALTTSSMNKTLNKGANEQGGEMILRERGIYCLPNGRELVVLRNDEEGSVLYGPVPCERSQKGEFVVNEAGRLVCEGKLTAWDVSNLSDTGRTAMDMPYALRERVPQSEING